MNPDDSPADPIGHLFKKRLPLVMGGEFEERPSQLAMARDIGRCLGDDRLAVFEAETGLGKSIAYLLPLLARCRETGRRAVISTDTRTLQQQLISKDFPQAARILDRDIEAATLLGRTNYACRLEIHNLLKTAGLDPLAADYLRRLDGSGHGEIENQPGADGIDPASRRKIVCPAREAICRGCRLRESCHLLKARRRAQSAQVVFVNHALLFSDLAAAGSLLGPYDLLVVDEAHHLPEVATDFFSLSFSPRSLRGGPHSVYTSAYEEVVSYARQMVTVEHPEAADTMEVLWRQFHEALESAHRATLDLLARFGQLSARTEFDPPPGRFENNNSPIRYLEGSHLLLGLEAEGDDVRQQLGRMHHALEQLADIVAASEGLTDGAAATVKLLRDVTRETLDSFSFLMSAGDENYVFYAGVAADGRVASLAAAPIDVSVQLGAFLDDFSGGAVLTSATLSVGNDFSYVLGRLGLSGSPRVETRRYESPFDLDRQREVFLASWLPDPKQGGFTAAAAEAVGGIIETIPRKTLILCTSHRQLGAIKKALSSRPDLGRLVLAQTDGASRSELMDRFKQQPDKQALLGLVSFWEGVDFPGELLELVIIVKMPFLVPTEPVAQARTERMRAAGDDPFMDYVLPDSILKLRQGSGRLIRTGRDRGAVIILDSRLDHRPYGDVVLSAVYNRVTRAGSGEALLAGLERLFGRETEQP